LTTDQTDNRKHLRHPRRLVRYTRRLRRIPSLWARLGALSLFVAALLVGMVGLTLKAIRPYHEAGVEAARLQSTRQQAAGMEARNETLQHYIAYLKTPDGIAEEAHRLGYMRPGEKPLVILGLSTPDISDDSAAEDASRVPSSSRNTSLFDRFQSHLRDL
jgi:cell division protein FtsB